MLIRITLIAAIVLGIAAGVLNFVQVKDKIQTTMDQRDKNAKDRDDEKTAKMKAQKELASTKTMLQRTNDALVATTKERDDALAKSEADAKTAADLTAALAKTKADLELTKNDLEAWHTLGIPLANIKATLESLKAVTEEREALATENKILTKKKYDLEQEVLRLTDPDYEVKMTPGLKGKVLAVDPRFDFVVLNIGSNQGALAHGRLLVTDKGKLVAKVEIRTLQADSCIANVMPGWKVKEVMEGDRVIY